MKTPRALFIISFLALSLAPLAPAAETNQTETAEADAKKGTVIFYRTRAMKGGAIRLNITGGDTGTVGLLTNGSKLVRQYEPKELTFVATSPSIAGRDSVTIDIKAGETYYVKGEALMGWPAARPRFTLVDSKKGKAEADKIK